MRTADELLDFAQEMLDKMESRHAPDGVHSFVTNIGYTKQGNFTIVDVNGYMGIAKCNPNDTYNEDIGIHLATNRAIRNMLRL